MEARRPLARRTRHAVHVALTLAFAFALFARLAAEPHVALGVDVLADRVVGDYTNRVPEIEVGGTKPGTDYDQLVVTGTATFADTLRVSLAEGYTPVVGDQCAFVSAGGIAGQFAVVEVDARMGGSVVYGPNGLAFTVGVVVAGEPGSPESPAALPAETGLDAPAPNPSRGAATVRYALAAPAAVRIAVVDLFGREVAVLADAEQHAGRHTVSLGATRLAAGVYVVRMVVGPTVFTRRVVVVR